MCAHWYSRFLTVALFGVVAGCGPAIKIIDRPIPFSAERVQLTRDYLAMHYGVTAADITITPRVIVLHWTAIDDFEKSFATFAPERLPASRPELRHAGEANVAIHFLVGQDGSIHRLMPENWMARHCIGLNYESIGVENVGGQDGVDNLTDAQVAANIKLVHYLVQKFPTLEYLIGHHEYLEFVGHPLWRERDPNYRTEKIDPGDRFMTAVRTGVAALNLKGVVEIRQEKQLPN
ncbi:MAG: peptidoglycan recognition protein family protein [candidate division KSB1 bacterium]|nr:peptidoglycan recognition protein family protein [candidate division KSB1 bacterium]MDZ7288184.1 peptidoglycan recognition protein family protein [candidate division KSB1 bacterium]MDZ7300303.1 peptidoglycan recognition protein family protein [candidate division KSB1 bacterium]MDZ7351303.1 peptidoglycan recognition protein family protein [candidate division KSB1 bacterium]MDZ7355607.1 peptidoglycan recognition protein family protein [candidate division KSB1 bacterium]